MNILFVCTGNTCRSPMAEALLRSLASDKSLALEVKSAGIAAFPGTSASPQAHAVLKKRGINIEHESKPVSNELIEWADLILTMTEAHRDAVLSMAADSPMDVHTLKEYVEAGPPYDIIDPFGGDELTYEQCLFELEGHLRKLLHKLERDEKDKQK